MDLEVDDKIIMEEVDFQGYTTHQNLLRNLDLGMATNSTFDDI